MKTITRITAFVALAAALGLAACSSKPADPAPLNTGTAMNETDNATAETVPPVAETPPVAQAQTGTDPVANPGATPSTDATPSAQVSEDADASGMTARLPETNENAPVLQ